MTQLKTNPPTNRLGGSMPKIGIRPTIDGRLGGVRESLEVQTMNMARAVAEMLETNLRHANGLPVECVLADGTIDAIATDHAPHVSASKELPLDQAPPGMLGLETALGVAIAHLDMPLVDILAAMSWKPAATPEEKNSSKD